MYSIHSTNISNYSAWNWQPEKKNHDLVPELAAYTLTQSFSYASHQCGRDSLTPSCHIYTVAGGPQYYGHLRPTPEGSVRWYARRASSMCTCMSPRVRWKMVHRSYLYMLSVSVMQAGVTCTNISNYTALKWQLEKKNSFSPVATACITLTDSIHSVTVTLLLTRHTYCTLFQVNCNQCQSDFIQPIITATSTCVYSRRMQVPSSESCYMYI